MTASRDKVARSVTAIMGTVVALTFLFGFGNVLNLALRLGVPTYVAPLVAPAVDLSVLGLLLGTRYLALHGASAEQLRPAKRLLLFASAVTLALNVAEPIYAHNFGKAAFDAVGPLLLIGWAEVGPALLQAIQQLNQQPASPPAQTPTNNDLTKDETRQDDSEPATPTAAIPTPLRTAKPSDQDKSDPLLTEAYQLDAEHWQTAQRPISAETLRKRLHIGATRARHLVAQVREARAATVTVTATDDSTLAESAAAA